jgi:hypothetical protein
MKRGGSMKLISLRPRSLLSRRLEATQTLAHSKIFGLPDMTCRQITFSALHVQESLHTTMS